jgi:predicted Ser/Thr protein kinase
VTPAAPRLDLEALLPAIEAAVAQDAARVNAGHQGSVHLLEHDGRRFIVKAPTGRGLLRRIRERHLRHEHHAYTLLAGVAGVPHCHGLAGGRFLVLDYVEGPNIRDAVLLDPAAFYERVRAVILAIHARGVAHADLKRRDNILVTAGEEPALIDFGLAVVRKAGFHPLNEWLFRLACRVDLNAWIKHKYRYREDQISDADRRWYRPMVYETLWRGARRVVRAPWRALRKLLSNG